MDLKKIKVEEIPEAVRDWCEEHTSSTSFTFAAYLEYIDGEIVERIFGSRRYKRNDVKIHEVIRDCTGDGNDIIARDLLYTRMSGYRVVFEASDVYNRSYGWAIKVFDKEDFGKWYKPDGNIGCAFTYINPELIFTIPEYADGWNSAIDIIENAPTADAVEVRHGYWDRRYSKHIDHLGEFLKYEGDFCSICGTLGHGKYCSECGAKMDGKRREE